MTFAPKSNILFPNGNISKEKLAFVVSIYELSCVVFATSRSKAKYIAVKSYWEAYGKRGWPSVEAKREPKFDLNQLAKEPQTAWCYEYVQNKQYES